MVVVEGLSFGYRQEEAILTDLSFTFPSGVVSAVTGPSGRGKSTLLYLIGLLLSPWEGSIVIDGTETVGLADRVRSVLRGKRIGFVFQDAALDASRTVVDNVVEGSVYVGMSRRQARRRAAELMERFGVGLRADHKPGEVSGGQAQRVALCRALLTDPDVVLADEPTGNLDVDTSRIVVDALRTAAHQEGKTVIIATHDPTIIEVCDRVLEL
ncbi:MAG: ABC transporter ATP-binding protein [Acidimicrobiia bacterium]